MPHPDPAASSASTAIMAASTARRSARGSARQFFPQFAARRLMRWRSVKFLPALLAQCTRSGGEIEPGFFRAHTSVAHDLQFQRAPAREPFVVQGRGVAGQDGIAGQGLEQFQQLYVVLFLIVETVSAPRCTGVMEIGRIAVDQFAPPRSHTPPGTDEHSR